MTLADRLLPTPSHEPQGRNKEVETEENVPILAIGAFYGLRTAELQRLDWKDLKFEERAVIVGADKAKIWKPLTGGSTR